MPLMIVINTEFQKECLGFFFNPGNLGIADDLRKY